MEINHHPHHPPAIVASGVTKSFGDVAALAGLDLVAEAGQVTAILGPNGAGKTTFVRMVATLLRPDQGSLHVAGFDAVADPVRVRRLIGLAGQSASVDPALTGRENLLMVARLFGHRGVAARTAADAVLAAIDLVDDGDRPVKQYSGGMKRRLDLGASLVGAPRLLLLDEPTTGLDPRTRGEMWATVRSLVAQGTDVLLTTQYLEEADQLADRVVIVDGGRVVTSGTPGELKGRSGRDVIEVRVRDADRLGVAVTALSAIGSDDPWVDVDTRRVVAPVLDGPDRLATVLAELTHHQVVLDDISLRRPTLDEVFLAHTGANR